MGRGVDIWVWYLDLDLVFGFGIWVWYLGLVFGFGIWVWYLDLVRSSRLPLVDPGPRQKFSLLPRVSSLFYDTGGFSSNESPTTKREYRSQTRGSRLNF